MSSAATATAKPPILRRGDLTTEDVARLRGSYISAWDIETTGLNPHTARIGTVQIADETGATWLVQVGTPRPPSQLVGLLADSSIRKLFHFAPFDLGFMRLHWDARAQNVACTKVLDRLVNPVASSHSLRDVLARELAVDLPKPASIRVSDWSAESLRPEQLAYALADVRHLVHLYDVLMDKAARKGISRLAEHSFDYLPTRVETELLGVEDVFAY